MILYPVVLSQHTNVTDDMQHVRSMGRAELCNAIATFPLKVEIMLQLLKANERILQLDLSRNELGEHMTGSLLQQALGWSFLQGIGLT